MLVEIDAHIGTGLPGLHRVGLPRRSSMYLYVWSIDLVSISTSTLSNPCSAIPSRYPATLERTP
jgi:hypothetical protein